MAKRLDDVEQCIAAIKDAWELGHKILLTIGTSADPGRVKDMADKYGLNVDTVRKRRAIASEQQGYTTEDLAKLLLLARKHRYEIAPSFLDVFITVPKGKKRNELQRLACKGHWNRQQIRDWKLRTLGRHEFKRGHRTPKVPESLDELLAALETRTGYWPELVAQLGKSAQVPWHTLPEKIQRRISEAAAAMRRLEEATREERAKSR